MSATTADTVRGWVDETYQHHRRIEEMKCDAAAQATARALGLSPRRVTSIRGYEPVRLSLDEYDRIKAGFRRHLDRVARLLDQRAKVLAARRDALR